MSIRPGALIFAAFVCLTISPGCQQSAIDANNQQLKDQQAQIDQLKQQISVLQSGRASYSTAPLQPGACDQGVMAEATRKGGERMAAGDVPKALGYYQDAATACPTNGEAQLNLGNAYEAIGDRAEALQHYRSAAAATGTDPTVVQKAREALKRNLR
jgi:Flp pilus assembly protein TadD